MSRKFELTSPFQNGQAIEIIDLEKICRLRVEDSSDGIRIKIWFVGGQQVDELVDRTLARRLLDAYAGFLGNTEKH
jgi:hypothetical protein